MAAIYLLTDPDFIVPQWNSTGGGTPAPSKLATPTNFRQTTSTTTAVTLAWNAVANATSYRLLQGGSVQIGVSGTTYTGGPGSYQVQALYGPDSSLNSDYSAAVQATVTATPTVPLIKEAGQSNDEGLALISSLYTAPLNTATPSFTREFATRIWSPSAGALQQLRVGQPSHDGTGGGNSLGQQGSDHPASYEDGFGPNIGLAQRLEQEGITNAVLAKYAKGATSIKRWLKSANDLYPNLKATIVNARAAVVATGSTPDEKGMYWDQWETDAGSTTYQADLQQFYNDLKADGLIGSTEKFVVCAAQDANMLAQQQAFVNANPAAILLTPASIAYIPNDNLHYDARTQLAIGGNSLYNILFNTTGSINIPAPITITLVQEDDPLMSYPNGQWTHETGMFYKGGYGLVTGDPNLIAKMTVRTKQLFAYSPKAQGVGAASIQVFDSSGNAVIPNGVANLGDPNGVVYSDVVFDSGNLPLDDYTITWRILASDGRPIFFDAFGYV